MTTPNTYLTVQGCRIRDTEKAILFRIHKIRETAITPSDQWFPKSQVTKDSTVGAGEDQDTSWLLVSEWIMEQKGLLESSTPVRYTETPATRKNQNEPYYPTPSPNIKDSFGPYDNDIPF